VVQIFFEPCLQVYVLFVGVIKLEEVQGCKGVCKKEDFNMRYLPNERKTFSTKFGLYQDFNVFCSHNADVRFEFYF